jgi:hypothetical protein
MFRFLKVGASRMGLLAASALVSGIVSAGVVAAVALANLPPGMAVVKQDFVQKVDNEQFGGDWVTVAPGGIGLSTAYCPTTFPYVAGGGYEAHGTLSETSVMSAVGSYAGPTRTSWIARVVNPAGAIGPVSFRAIAMCLHIERALAVDGVQ